MSSFFAGTSELMINGGTFNNATNMSINQSKRAIDVLMDWLATDAMHNSKELYDAPKCHPHTRVAVLADIMKWVIESEAQDQFMMWLFGPAGAGKSAIAKKIAEVAARKGLLVGSFFFSRTSPTRSTQDCLVATIAYQMTVSIPGTRNHIENLLDRDPAIFHKTIQTQIEALLIKPFQSASAQTIPIPKLIIIDGLDECSGSQAQVAILDSISRSFTTHKFPVKCLVVSRPEIDLVSSFNCNEPLKFIHRRLALDNNYFPYSDIRRFFSDKFEEIRCTHRLRSTIPTAWPTEESLEMLVTKSSGHFIFAATVVKFLESNRHRPAERLNIVLGISPTGTINPFAELDALYKHILSCVDDIQLTLRVLNLFISSPSLAMELSRTSNMSERFLSLEEGDIDRALTDLSSIVSYNESSGEVKILHASFVDFLSDKRRSNEFYIDMASVRADIACRTLQYVKGPDGIRAGDVNIFSAGIRESNWILNRQLRNEILNFDLDSFIAAATKSPYSHRMGAINWILGFWMDLILNMGLEVRDKCLLIDRCTTSFESRMTKYQSDWRLQLLLTFAPVMKYLVSQVPAYRCLDILLEMDDNKLHLVDQEALDLRYCDGFCELLTDRLSNITICYVDGGKYASAALHCMRFLSNPPQYSGSNHSAGVGVTHAEWEVTCEMALGLLCRLLNRADTSPELIQFMSNHDIDTTFRNIYYTPSRRNIWEVDTHILAFLSREGVCVNWRIISEIRRVYLQPIHRRSLSRQRKMTRTWKFNESKETD